MLGNVVDKSRRKFIKQVGAAGALATLPKGAKMLMKKTAKALPRKLIDVPAFNDLKTQLARQITLYDNLGLSREKSHRDYTSWVNRPADSETFEEFLKSIDEDTFTQKELLGDMYGESWQEMTKRAEKPLKPLETTNIGEAVYRPKESVDPDDLEVQLDELDQEGYFEGWLEGKNPLDIADDSGSWDYSFWGSDIEDYEGVDFEKFANTMMEDYGLSKQELADYLRQNKFIYRGLDKDVPTPQAREYVKGSEYDEYPY